jgi:hypothetical protein
MDYESILNYLDEIENEFLITSNEGQLIIDQLLVTGNSKNRFISCQFSYGKIELKSALNIDAKKEFKEITSEILKQYFSILKYSILTDNQLLLIREGHAI